MNPRAIQRAVVRMLYEPAFVAAIHGARAVPGLGEAERELLRRVDRRAFATDPFRRARALQAIVEEFPASAAVVGLSRVEEFLRAPEFLRCLAERRSMALEFGAWLGDQAGGIGRIEAAMAELRRAEEERAPGLLRCAARFGPVSVPAGSLEWYEATRAWLGTAPLRTLTEQAKGPTRRAAAGEEHVLIEMDANGEMSLGTASEALVRLLRFARRARTRRALEREAVARGAERGEAAEVIEELLAQGLLVAG